MSFPHKEELRLKKVFEFATNKILKSVKKNKSDVEIIEALEKFEFSKEEKKEIVNLLGEVASSTSKHIFNNWRTLSDDELIRNDLTNAKKWIKQNYDSVNATSKTMGEFYSNYKTDTYLSILKSFEDPLKYKLDKLMTKEINTSDMKKLMFELKQGKNNKEIKEMISLIEKGINVSPENLSKLRMYALRKNELRARNEVGNLYSSELEAMMYENGIDDYIWRTMEDNNVREDHKKRDRKIYSVYDGNLPGSDFGCRCWAEPVRKGVKK